MKKVLLYSGGMDSWLIDKLWHPDVKLYIDIGGSYSQQEISRLPGNVIIEKLDLGRFEREDKIIPLRNLFFVSLASLYGEHICLGATYGDRVLDKSPEFAEQAGELLSYLWQPQHWTPGKQIVVDVSFKDYTKAELLFMYRQVGGSMEAALHQSYSCYYPGPDGRECWSCKACARKAIAFILNGYHFPRAVNDAVLHYLAGIIPQIEAGTYGRGKEELEIMRAYQILKS